MWKLNLDKIRKSRGKDGLKMPRMDEQEKNKNLGKEERESGRNERTEIIRQKARTCKEPESQNKK